MLKLQYFGHLMRRTDSLEKTLMLGKIEGGRRRGLQRMRWLDGRKDPLEERTATYSGIFAWRIPWTLSVTNSQSLLKPMSIESVMPSNHLILCCPLFLLPSIFPIIRLTLRDPVDCSPPGSSIPRVFQARILEWAPYARLVGLGAGVPPHWVRSEAYTTGRGAGG